jgi:hypothetical protein
MCSMEIYHGKDATDRGDLNTGPNAVVRNISTVLKGLPAERLIITDRFYSCVLLSNILLAMGLYHVGTVQLKMKGTDLRIPFTQKKRPKEMPRGSFRMAQSNVFPEMVQLCWFDNTPVNFIATGCATTMTSVTRRSGNGTLERVPCPQLVRDYQEGMGGADTHDQLRLHRYSIQMAVRFRKYYKTIFLGLVDMAIVNAFIIHREAKKQAKMKPWTHAEFMRELQKNLLAVDEGDFSGDLSVNAYLSSPMVERPLRVLKSVPASHSTAQCTETRTTTQGDRVTTKLRQFACKVCSVLKGERVKALETTFYCVECSVTAGGRVYLCNRVRQHDPQVTNHATCNQIWHKLWANGTILPTQTKNIRMRSLKNKKKMIKKKKITKKKAKVRSSPHVDDEDEEDADEDNADNDNADDDDYDDADADEDFAGEEGDEDNADEEDADEDNADEENRDDGDEYGEDDEGEVVGDPDEDDNSE